MTRRVLALLFAVVSSGCALAPLYSEPLPLEAERHRIRTGDGWGLSLVRYPPRGPAVGRPVLLCHGIAGTGRTIDIDDAHSLPRWLAQRGRETFVLTLRGGGESDRPAPAEGRSPEHSIDTFATQDLPAAFAAIRSMTGAEKVDYVGHSMGGLVGYIYVARGGEDVGALVILGSPVRFPWKGQVERLVKHFGPKLKNHIVTVDIPALAHPLMPLHGEVTGWLDWLLYNPDNVSAESYRKMMAMGLAPVSGGVLRQFSLWFEHDAMLSADGTLDYRALLPRARGPALVIAGKLDRFAPPPAVKAGYDAFGGPKRFFIAGEENGFAHDYGHMDLMLGDRAPQELWPRVLAFLEEWQTLP